MQLPTYQVFSDTTKQYRFRLRSLHNAEIILVSSESYVNKSDCLRAVEICQTNSPLDHYYEKKQNQGHYYFILKANNGEEIGISEMYTTSFNRDSVLLPSKETAR